jgi:RNA polymerase sigma-70 factor, ECF subfamily
MVGSKPWLLGQRAPQGAVTSHAERESAVFPKAPWQPDFERLLSEHQSMVFSLAWRMTGDRGLAEEVAQDVFLELDRSMHKIESPQHALFWLRRVAMSRSADALRRRRVRGVDLWVEIEENHGAASEDRPSPLGARLEALLATLPEPHRAALVLRYQEDLTPEEIAATLDSPLATVKSNLQRGLKLLRAKAETNLKDYLRPGRIVRGAGPHA